MEGNLGQKISNIIEDKLSGQEIEEVIRFLRQSMTNDRAGERAGLIDY
jgi:hypothetical protein